MRAREQESQQSSQQSIVQKPAVVILRRPQASSSNGTGENGNGNKPKTQIKSLHQRQQEYAEARMRILGSMPDDDSEEWVTDVSILRNFFYKKWIFFLEIHCRFGWMESVQNPKTRLNKGTDWFWDGSELEFETAEKFYVLYLWKKYILKKIRWFLWKIRENPWNSTIIHEKSPIINEKTVIIDEIQQKSKKFRNNRWKISDNW